MADQSILTSSPARLVSDITARERTCAEVMEAFLERIETVNPAVNAICTLDDSGAREQAIALDAALARGQEPGPLCGLPIAIKDLVETRGMRTTQGSPLLSDAVPDYDQLFVTRLRAAGAIVIGKTNTPEFGAGSQTFNPIFGATRNPYDLSRTVGGSSGGAAASLASRMLPIADGSDFGGSLRNPASFCNVVGFRVSPGVVPAFPKRMLYEDLSVLGPMGRETADVALLLSVMAGADPRDPLSGGAPTIDYQRDLQADFKDCRIAWTPDLGFLPVEKEVLEVLAESIGAFADLGCHVEEAAPDLRGAEEIFLTLRSARFVAAFDAVPEMARHLLKDTIRWNIEQGQNLTPVQIASAEARRTDLYQGLLQFFEKYDFLALPAVQVTPFAVETEWVKEIEGQKLANYLQWMQSCCVISLMPVPALSVPGGFTESGLPVGLQLVGRPRGDWELLQLAHAFEQATRFVDRPPSTPELQL
jgi:amidase